MTKGTLEIHGQNILPIIKRWLYSDKDIFVRELVSNACDAISKRRVLYERSQAEWEEPRIELRIDSQAQQLIIEDTGLGMESEELVRYLSQVAFSSAEEFLKHYEGTSREQIIGHFGLGFYSAFMVASHVEVDSLSYREGAEPARWSCDGGVEYQIERGLREKVGTRITLTLEPSSSEYLEPRHLEEILVRYTRFLPYPIYLNGRAIEQGEPLWLRPPKECTREQYLEFYQKLYPHKREPLFWIHLDVDHPFRLKGILYFPHKELLRESTDAIALYCNRVFVSEGCRDILPSYLLPLHGALDSPDLPLNVSRSALQIDRSVRQLSAHIAKKVADKLKEIYQNDRSHFEQVWPDIEVIVKWGALEDEKFFERVQELVLWKNDRGEWTSLSNYLERCQSSHPNKVFYGLADQLQAPCMRLYKQRGWEVLIANELIDPPFFAHLEAKMKVQFQRIDAQLDEALIDRSREPSVLDEQGQTYGTRLAQLFKSLLGSDRLEVEAKSLSDDALPALLTIDEQQRRFSDYIARQGQTELDLERATLVLNTNNPLIQAIEKLSQQDRQLAQQMGSRVLDLARLSQQRLSAEQKQQIVENTWQLMSHLVSKLL